MTYNDLEKSAARLITRVFESPNWVKYPYHNLMHTKAVVEHVNQIGEFYKLDEKDMAIISIAAWFHDIGQLSGDMLGHEERSVAFMKNYFTSTDAPEELMQPVQDCIMATKLGSLPHKMNEKILCDADTWHFGTAYFHETEFMMKKEMEIRTGEAPLLWHEGSLQLLKHHVFFTEYAQLLLAKGKQDNIEWLQSLI